jgi:superfamily II DNA or RNA helicase
MHGEALSLFDRVVTQAAPSAPRAVAAFDGYGLRSYQRDAAAAAVAQLGQERSTLIVMATGLGKTQTFGAIAAEWPGRVLVLAHREELIDQAVKRLRAMTGEFIGREQAWSWAEGERIVVGSVQTLVGKARRERFKAAPFTLIVVDEAHHTTAKSYRKILDTFPDAKVLGVTATPDRGDGSALGDIYSTVAYTRDIETGIDDGYLTPVSVRQVILEEIDLSRVKTTAGDLNIGGLDDEMVKAQKAIALKALEECGDRKTILFYTKVESAHDLASVFNDPEILAKAGRPVGVVARAVDGETPPDERKAILEGHARGDFQFLINVGIATEGYDSPGVSCVAIARPTKSRALYTQMAGRGLRVLPGTVDKPEELRALLQGAGVTRFLDNIDEAEARRAGIAASAKPDCLLLDFSGNSGRHKLVHPLDILGGKFPEDEMERAKKLLAEKKMGAKDALSLARDQLVAERKARADALAALKLAKLKARVVEVDPFRHSNGEQVSGLPPGQEAPTQKQVNYLVNGFRVRPASVPKTKREASILIDHLKRREEQGLASWVQEQTLTRYGVSAKSLSLDQARRLIQAIDRNGGRLPASEQVNAIINPPREPGAEG